MKKSWIGILFAMALSGLCPAQESAPPPTSVPQGQQTPATAPSAQTGGPVRIAPGSVIPVQLSKTLDAKKVKNGDAVEAKVAEDLKTQKGDVLVPKDTKIVGHITEAQPRSKGQNESQLGIAFDHMILKGTDVTMPMSIQAIIGQSALNGGAGNSSQGEGSYPAPGAGGVPPGSTSGRPPGMGTGTAPQPQTSPAPGEAPSPQRGATTHPPITGDTQGVVGISNLKLSTSESTQAGSVVSSEKGNVKLDGGTMMLLRVK
jgi:hypothetical protein